MNEAAREEICASCHGSGTTTAMHGGLGPDDYEVDVSCPKCGGTGTLPATPKPRAGEQTDERIAELEEVKRAHIRDIHSLWAERDFLRERERELLEALSSLMEGYGKWTTRQSNAGEWLETQAKAKALLAKHGR